MLNVWMDFLRQTFFSAFLKTHVYVCVRETGAMCVWERCVCRCVASHTYKVKVIVVVVVVAFLEPGLTGKIHGLTNFYSHVSPSILFCLIFAYRKVILAQIHAMEFVYDLLA